MRIGRPRSRSGPCSDHHDRNRSSKERRHVGPCHPCFSFVQTALQRITERAAETARAGRHRAVATGGSASIGVNERDGGTPYDARLLFDADGTSMQRRTQDLAHASRADDLGARETARACAPSFTRRWFRAHRRGSPSRPSFPAACAGVCLLRRLRNGTAGSRPASTQGHRAATSARSRAVASGRSAPDGRCRASPSSDEVVVTTDLDFTLIESEATEGLPRPLTAGRNCPAS